MPKRSRKKPVVREPLRFVPKARGLGREKPQSPFDLVQQIIARTEGTGEKNPLAVVLGRLGGLKGGHARAVGMTAKARSESARKAAQARWARKPTPRQ